MLTDGTMCPGVFLIRSARVSSRQRYFPLPPFPISPLCSPSVVRCRHRSHWRFPSPHRPSAPSHRIRLYELCPDHKPSGQRPPGARSRALSVFAAARMPPSGLSTSGQDRRHIVLLEPQGDPADFSDQADGRPDRLFVPSPPPPSSSCHGRHFTADS
jgi:hypothetical protein